MESELFTQHISKKFNDELENLRSQVMAMGGLVEQQLEQAIEALLIGNSELGLAVADRDVEVNRFEVEIDEECNRILAIRSPAAGDLRLIVAVIKTITDLERIGDEAERIGRLAARLAGQEQSVDGYDELKALSEHVQEMLHDTLDAVSRLDVDDALRVAELDKVVDQEYDMILRQCISLMMEDPRTVSRFMDISWVARALERIGDHATNICEYVVYLVEGKDIRHISLSEVKKTIAKTDT